jgi:formylglycine-generating enzyme required for sulfatase activity
MNVNPKDGAEMVNIPEGNFLMGDDDDDIIKRNNPRHTVNLPGYWMYKNLVSVAQYFKFCDETGHTKPSAPGFNPGWQNKDHPIVGVSWDDAMAYCEWASKDGVKVTLPTVEQWEKAARGTDARKFPWGDVWDASKCHNSVGSPNSVSGTVSVGRYTDSPYGLSDMVGNVIQWCVEWNGYYGAARGCDCCSSIWRFRCSHDASGPGGWIYCYGFRCAVLGPTTLQAMAKMAALSKKSDRWMEPVWPD